MSALAFPAVDNINIFMVGSANCVDHVSRLLAPAPSIAVTHHANANSFALDFIRKEDFHLALIEMGPSRERRIELLTALRRIKPDLPVLLLTTPETHDAFQRDKRFQTFPLLSIDKPAPTQSSESLRQSGTALILEIQRLCGRHADVEIISRPRPASKHRSPIEIVAIGSSTGGPEALASIFSKFQQELPVPVVLAQHMPTMFTRLLAERLQSVSRLRVKEASSGDVLSPGGAWIAPGNFHMEVRRKNSAVEIFLHQQPPVNSSRPSVDVLLRSVAATYKSAALAIILTGMGKDGVAGCEAVHCAGGQVIAQDEETSIVWGMPGRVAKSGLADKILPVDQIGDEILKRMAR